MSGLPAPDRAGMERVPNVLSIAGSDPAGGAGIQADLKTFAALEVYGCAVPAVLTAQNTRQVSRVFGLPGDFLEVQLRTLFDDVQIDAVKIGMLGSRDAVVIVARTLREYRPPTVVLDPVLRASTGAALLDDDALAALRCELLPLTTLVMPNAAEAGALLGRAAPRTVSDAESAAADLCRHGARAALVTGGHLELADVSTDVLHSDGEVTRFDIARVPHDNHGTGCTLSAALAAYLARGESLKNACALAQRFVASAMRESDRLAVGRGRSPVWHGVGARG